jgi:hypothetical protein
VYPLIASGPQASAGGGATSSLLVEVPPKSVKMFDIGANTSGAIGRLSVKEDCLSLDIKGFIHTGHIMPTVTCLFVKVDGKNQNLVIEGITDEVCTLKYDRDTMSKMMDDDAFDVFDDGEEDENRKKKTKTVASKKKSASKK